MQKEQVKLLLVDGVYAGIKVRYHGGKSIIVRSLGMPEVEYKVDLENKIAVSEDE